MSNYLGPSPLPEGPTRRSTLKTGVIATGAALWAVPAVQTLSMSAAHAEATSPTGEPQPTPTGKYISHGFVLVTCAGQYYAVKVGSDGSVDSAGNNDRDYLAARGYTNITRGIPAGFVGSQTVHEGEYALKLVVPTTCSIVMGIVVSFDGSFDDDNTGPQDKFAPATILPDGRTVIFRVSDDDD
ncbi:hypothetical protein [Aquipuribacter nitratireducens]|uniref:Twin-arginine translocation pathway signal n=1 Tax=Aquipuribacter nitratireducens TaxID=650104 RepID=A0ABW0GQH0_9MICO